MKEKDDMEPSIKLGYKGEILGWSYALPQHF